MLCIGSPIVPWPRLLESAGITTSGRVCDASDSHDPKDVTLPEIVVIRSSRLLGREAWGIDVL